MWLSDKLTTLLELNVEEVKRLREELAVVRAEREQFKFQAAIAQNNFEWARVKLNALEFEKAALLQKAFNFNLPAPEIVRTARDLASGSFQLADLFESMPLDEHDDSV